MDPLPLSARMQSYLENLTRKRRRRWAVSALAGGLAAGLVALLAWQTARNRSAWLSLRPLPENSSVTTPTSKPELPSLEELESELAELDGVGRVTASGPSLEQLDAMLTVKSSATKRSRGGTWTYWQEQIEDLEAAGEQVIRMTATGPVVLDPADELTRD